MGLRIMLVVFAAYMTTMTTLIISPATPGLVIMDGCTQAFALCVDESDDELVVYRQDEMTIKVFPTYTLYVNVGYEEEECLVNLRAMAVVHCDD